MGIHDDVDDKECDDNCDDDRRRIRVFLLPIR